MAPQCFSGSSAHSAAFPPSITTSPRGCSIRNQGTGISYSSPRPWFILMFSTWHFSVPLSNMWSFTTSFWTDMVGTLSSAPVLPVRHGRVDDMAQVVRARLAWRDHEQALLLERSLDECGHVVLRVAELGDATRRADVLHQLAQQVRSEEHTPELQ